MNERKSYSQFVESVRAARVERLNASTLLYWVTLLKQFFEIQETKFIRRGDSTIWLASPELNHIELSRYAGDPRVPVVDAGTIRFTGEDAIDVAILDNSGSLNLGHSDEERRFTYLILLDSLGEEARSVS